MSNLSGLSTVNVELTSRCNKKCWICGRRKREKENPNIISTYGDMSFNMVEEIANQLPSGIVVQFHNNGEPLLYPHLGRAIDLYGKQITSLDTNGKLLLDKSDDIIGKLDTIAISIFEGDSEADSQFDIIKKFLKIKGNEKPLTILRLNGDVDDSRYSDLNIIMTKRLLHSPMGSFKYKKKNPTIPEIGLCLDFLHHLSISRNGKVSICVRFDPYGHGVIGDILEETLNSIWNGYKRIKWLEFHKQGKRKEVPLCKHCDFWGVPTGL